jgi:hypothetical protein
MSVERQYVGQYKVKNDHPKNKGTRQYSNALQVADNVRIIRRRRGFACARAGFGARTLRWHHC